MLSSYDPITNPLRPTLLTRLHFGWSLVWIWIWTVFCALGYLVSQAVRPTTSVFTWWASTWGRLMAAFMGLRFRIEGAERIDRSRPCVFVANHQNSFDIPVVAATLPVPFGFVAKAELEHWPFIGPTLKHSPSVFVDPSDPRRSLASMKKAAAEIREGSSVLVFPEGQRSFDGVLQPFMRGAFTLALESGVPLVPVTIVDAAGFVDESRYASRPGTIHVVVGDPIPLEGLTRKDLPRLMEQVRDDIARYLPAPWRGAGAVRTVEPGPASPVGSVTPTRS